MNFKKSLISLLHRRDKKEKEDLIIKEKPSVTGLSGTLSVIASGAGFVSVEGEEKDYHIDRTAMGGAFHKDTVLIEPIPGSGPRKEARIIDVLSHNTTEVVGTVQKKRRITFLIPDDPKIKQDIFIRKGQDADAADGHKAVCRILHYGDGRRNPEGMITEILGHKDDPGVDILSVVKAYEVPTAFPEDVLDEAVNKNIPVTDKEIKGRFDLRGLPMVTIDGDDTKDFDDAVSLQIRDDEIILGVHIADVSHYVKEDSTLDKEAFARGTSIYLADRVIPMLPRALSNGICSLNEGTDRLALSCLISFDKKGKRSRYEIGESVIRVNHRMTYSDVNAMLAGNKELLSKYDDVADIIKRMASLSRQIRRRRTKRGAVEFEFPETKIKLDASGHPTEVTARERGLSERMIEDFMLCANECVAEEFFKKEIPFLYRVHEKPDKEKIRKLKEIAAAAGFTLRAEDGSVRPKDVQKLLKETEKAPEQARFQVLILRAMQRAAYSPDCLGHFGLAAKYYCHFTSPIRRYPDLIIHRIIKEKLHKKLKRKRKAHYVSLLSSVAKQCNETERRADDIQRDVEKMKKVQYMGDHIGETFTGKISGVSPWGFYVELPNTIEGLVRVASIHDDFYHYIEEESALVGERTGKRFTIGDEIEIIVESVNEEMRNIDFILPERGNGGYRLERTERPRHKKSGSPQKPRKDRPKKPHPSKKEDKKHREKKKEKHEPAKKADGKKNTKIRQRKLKEDERRKDHGKSSKVRRFKNKKQP